jgi:DNA helicase-2/ATP-dependent DNA helicase PcrA
MGAELGRNQAARWDGFCDDLRLVAAVAARGDTSDLIHAIVDRVGLGGSAQALDSGRRNAARSAHLDDLVAIQRAASLQPDPAEFIGWLRTSVERRPSPDGVTLSSVHRVKGMEWPLVVVFGADRGAMPHDLAEDLEEERRVFHVALTRASRAAVVLADEGRPSRFLDELDGSAPRQPGAAAQPARSVLITLPEVGDRVRLWGGLEGRVVAVGGDHLDVALDGGGTTTAGPADVVRVTRSDRGESPGDPALVEALKTWRRETAQRLNVPAYVVLHDKTIDGIAASKPQTETALLAISGIGPAKLDAYGDDILAVVAAAEPG